MNSNLKHKAKGRNWASKGRVFEGTEANTVFQTFDQTYMCSDLFEKMLCTLNLTYSGKKNAVCSKGCVENYHLFSGVNLFVYTEFNPIATSVGYTDSDQDFLGKVVVEGYGVKPKFVIGHIRKHGFTAYA